MSPEDLDSRFTWHTPKDGQPERYQALRRAARSMAAVINDLAPESREKSLAVTKLEEVVMWANASIARNE